MFGRALQNIFGSNIDQAQPDAELFEIGKPKTLEERFSKHLLGLMTRQAAGRLMASQKVGPRGLSSSFDRASRDLQAATHQSSRAEGTWPPQLRSAYKTHEVQGLALLCIG